MSTFLSSDDIRELFAQALSAMYQQEVSPYVTLLELISDVNLAVLEKDARLHQALVNSDELGRLNIERHGAIRIGLASELAMLRRVFAVMGMEPVGYYDLSAAGVPVHSTAFRPVSDEALSRNPFRVFTSWLRLELIADARLRKKAAAILARRDIFTSGCRRMLALFERQGGLTAAQAPEFVAEALETFRWHSQTQVDEETYRQLSTAHRLVADVVCFPGCHINHLTPRTLDIDRVQALMPEYGLTPKVIIEGPPRRQYPILLRQTSFQALDEPVIFSDGSPGHHRARFGETEQRGVALTPKGRELYDRLLVAAGNASDNLTHQQALLRAFSEFPDDEVLMRRLGLAYYRYRLTPVGEAHRHLISIGDDPQLLVERGWVSAQPVLYEDFLPVSAAGIFQSNLESSGGVCDTGNGQQDFEQALGCPVLDPFKLYAQAEARSKHRCGML